MIQRSVKHLLKRKAAIEKELRAREAIFDCSEKEQLAILCGLPFNTFYSYSFLEWTQMLWMARQFKDTAEMEWRGSDKTEVNSIWHRYKHDCKKRNKKTALDDIVAYANSRIPLDSGLQFPYSLNHDNNNR